MDDKTLIEALKRSAAFDRRIAKELEGTLGGGLDEESIELQTDKAFMKSHARAKKQIKDRDFGKWNGV